MPTAPTRIKILGPGLNGTIKGDVLFDAVAQGLMADSIKIRGVKIPFDIEHLSLAPRPDGQDVSEDSRAKAWGIPAVHGGELWIEDITYVSEEVKASVEAKELLYASPVFSMNGNRPVAILSCAFTNTPAINRIAPLTLSATPNEGIFPKMDEALKQILEAIAALAAKIDALGTQAPAKTEGLSCEEDKAVLSALTKITGKTSPQEAIGVMLALSLQAKSSLANDRTAKVDGLINDGRATPADREVLMSLSATAFNAALGAMSEVKKFSAPPVDSAGTYKPNRRLLEFSGLTEEDLKGAK